METGEKLELFAITAPGLEGITAAELGEFGIEGRQEPGGVSWFGSPAELYRANLHLRTASRVVVTAARFRARSFIELERHLSRIDWSRFLTSATDVALRVSSRKSRLYHERAIAERVLRQLDRPAAVGGISTDDAEEEKPAGASEQLFIIRFLRDECLIRADSSGALLHRRGYRQAVGKAPLRETLAAAMLLAVGWKGEQPLLDPFCGSGTIPIEAALLVRGIAPGLANEEKKAREYAFQRWPIFRPDVWDELVRAARAGIRESAGLAIVGSDRDEGAIGSARANALRAGVADDITFDVRPLSRMPVPSSDPGVLLTNPPYGQRVGDAKALRDLYAALGRVARERLRDWRVGMLVADPDLERQTGLPFAELFRTRNGGIPVRMVVREAGE